MITIKEIADLAGVSIGTVDRVLNHRGSVKKQTEEKILKIIKDNNYATNASGRSLSIQRKKIRIAYVYNTAPGNLFFNDIVDGMYEALKIYTHYNIQFIPVAVFSINPNDFIKTVNTLACSRHISGFILTTFFSRECAETVEKLHKKGIPIVTCNIDIENSPRLSYVGCNYYNAGRLAAAALSKIAHGEQSVAIIDIPWFYNDNNMPANRVSGFTDTLKNYPQFHIVSTSLVSGENEYDSYFRMRQLFSSHPEITSVFISSIAVSSFSKAIADLNAKNKLTVISVDEFYDVKKAVLSGIIDATICQNAFWQGSTALSILANYIITRSQPKERYFSNLEIKIRESFETESSSL